MVGPGRWEAARSLSPPGRGAWEGGLEGWDLFLAGLLIALPVAGLGTASSLHAVRSPLCQLGTCRVGRVSQASSWEADPWRPGQRTALSTFE